jgi:adenylosuccinate synthase
VQDLLEPKILRQKIEVALAEKNVWLERVYGSEALELEDLAARYEGFAQRLRPVRRGHLAARRPRAARRPVRAARGRAGDAARPRPRDVSVRDVVGNGRGRGGGGVGIGPNRIDAIIGVAEGVRDRVGEGPFPTEIDGADQERVRDLGAEYGTTTGRQRRCGWLDLVALRYAVRLNGITSLALTKLDVLSAFAELPVCIRYRLRDGSETPDFPAHQSDFHHCRPVYETLAGWMEPLDEVTELEALPENARRYVEFVERELEVPVSLIGTGAERERVLSPGSLEALARP